VEVAGAKERARWDSGTEMLVELASRHELACEAFVARPRGDVRRRERGMDTRTNVRKSVSFPSSLTDVQGVRQMAPTPSDSAHHPWPRCAFDFSGRRNP
jgi:hypothetical protein